MDENENKNDSLGSENDSFSDKSDDLNKDGNGSDETEGNNGQNPYSNGYGYGSPYQNNGYGGYYGGYYSQQNNGYGYQPQPPKNNKKALLITICACFVAIFLVSVAVLGYLVVDRIFDIRDDVVDLGGDGTKLPESGNQGEPTDSGSILSGGFDIVQAAEPGQKYASLSDAYEATHKSFVEIMTASAKTGSVGAGSGVIIGKTADGAGYYIVTNHHVIEDATEIHLNAYCEGEYKEYKVNSVLLSDENSDLAVIVIAETRELQIAKVGRSDSLRVGEDVFVIGNPLGTLAGTLTNGIISAQAVELVVGNHKMELLQTNAAINPGNSGGPMFNMSGELVGIVNAKYSDVSVEGIGFAIPIDIAVPLIEEMIRTGQIAGRHNLGINVQYNYNGAGLWITEFKSDSVFIGTSLPMSSSISYYYRVESIDGKVFESTTSANVYLDSLKAGDTVTFNITVYQARYGQLVSPKNVTVTVKLAQKSAISQ